MLLKTFVNHSELTHAGKIISRKEAQIMIDAWQQQEPDGIHSFLYGRRPFEKLLQVPGSTGIRIFNGLGSDNRQALVLVAVNEQGSNILSYLVHTDTGLVEANGPIIDGGIPCPPFCWPWDFTGDTLSYSSLADIGTELTRREAQAMIDNHHQHCPDAPISVFYGRHIFDTLLAIPGCTGIRIFNAINDKDEQTFVLVATDQRGKNIFSYETTMAGTRVMINAPLADHGIPCPPHCSGNPRHENH